jgi:hypothetical protein
MQYPPGSGYRYMKTTFTMAEFSPSNDVNEGVIIL